jgi:hypothetical protein
MSDWKIKHRRKKKEELRLKEEKRRKRMQQQDNDMFTLRQVDDTGSSNDTATTTTSATAAWFHNNNNNNNNNNEQGDDSSRAPMTSSASLPRDSPIKLLLRHKSTTSPGGSGTTSNAPGKKRPRLSFTTDDSPVMKAVNKKWLDSPQDARRRTQRTQRGSAVATKKNNNDESTTPKAKTKTVSPDDDTDDIPALKSFIDKKWLDPPRDRRIQQVQEEGEGTVETRKKAREKLPPKEYSKTVSIHDDDDDDDDDDDSDGSFDLLAEYRKSRQQKMEPKPPVEKQKPAPVERGTADPPPSKEPPNKRGPPVRDSQKSDALEDSDDNESTTNKVTTQMQIEETRSVTENSSKKRNSSLTSSRNTAAEQEEDENNIPHNPIALERQEQHKFQSIAENRARPKVEDDLWMDSDPEEEADPVKPTKRGKAKARGASNSKSNISRDSTCPQDLDALLSEEDGGRDTQRVLEQDEDALRSQLHPEIPNAPFGPYELKPLVLGGPDEEQPYEVPAPLSRYLAPFQREGVQFMYRCLAEGTGAIMGDEMVSSGDKSFVGSYHYLANQ